MIYEKFGHIEVVDGGARELEQAVPIGAVINAKIAEILRKHPLQQGFLGASGASSSGTGASGPRWIYGGGKVLVAPGIYYLEEVIKLPPNVELVLDAAHLVAHNDFPANSPMIETVEHRGVFSRNFASITGHSGAGLHGQNIADEGISMRLANYGNVSHVLVEGCRKYGVSGRQAQWCMFEHVTVHGCGEWGFYFGDDPTTSATFGCNDMTLTACHAEKNGIGGVLLESSGTSTITQLTTQFHEHGPGIRIQPGSNASNNCFGHTIVGGHYESNKRHIEILVGLNGAIPTSTSIHGGFFILDDGTGTGDGINAFPLERIIVNQGIKTSVFGGGSFNYNDMPSTLASSETGVETNALFEQSETYGDMHVHDFFRPTSENNPDQPYGCKSNGELWSDELNPQNGSFAVTAIGNNAAGNVGFPKGGTFGPMGLNV